MPVEQPAYRTVERDGAFELREYAPHLVASTHVDGEFEAAGNMAFRRLFRYISGNNANRDKIPMTAPVIQQAEAGGYRVAFVVPSRYVLASVPRPEDPTVEIRAVPTTLYASWRYSGRWTLESYQASERNLRRAMESRSLRAVGEPILARYDPPFMPGFLRRNEVLIPVDRSPPR